MAILFGKRKVLTLDLNESREVVFGEEGGHSNCSKRISNSQKAATTVLITTFSVGAILICDQNTVTGDFVCT